MESHDMAWLAAVRKLRRLVLHDSGQDLIEYGLLMLLIAIIAIGGVTAVGNTINTVFWEYIVDKF
jgi:Flp pilus assembly pilin Flp